MNGCVGASSERPISVLRVLMIVNFSTIQRARFSPLVDHMIGTNVIQQSRPGNPIQLKCLDRHVWYLGIENRERSQRPLVNRFGLVGSIGLELAENSRTVGCHGIISVTQRT